MKTNKKILLMLIFTCIAGLILTACGNDSGIDESENSNIKKTTIRFGILNDAGEHAAARMIVDSYLETKNDVEIRIERIPPEYNSAMLGYITSNTMPDVMYTNGEIHHAYSSQNIFEPLRPWIEEKSDINLEDFYETMLKSTHKDNSDDEIYFIPRDYNKIVVFYNLDMFDAAGVNYPNEGWTWEEFLEISRQLREKMDDNYDINMNINSDSYPIDGDLHWAPVYTSILYSMGGGIIEIDENSDNYGQPILNSSDSYNAMKHIREIIEKRYSTNPSEDQTDLFLYKRAAMSFGSRPKMISVVSQGMRFNIVSFPKIGDTPYIGAGCSGYAMPVKSQNKELAWDFIKYIVSPDGQEIFGDTGNGVPILKSLAENGRWRDYGEKLGLNLNHDAFVNYPERDLLATVFTMHNPEKFTDIKNNSTWVMTSLGTPGFGEHGGVSDEEKLTSLLDYYNQKIYEVINK